MVPSGLIAVVRAATVQECRTIVRGLVKAGVQAIEVTMTVPDAPVVISELARSGAMVGAGTVLDPDSCQRCIDAGARFIVSPVTDGAVLHQAHHAGVPYIGGALTPTEVVASMRAGSDAIKLFPIGAVGGVAYLRALRDPLPDLRAVISGGMTVRDAGDYLGAGAHAICMGGALIDRDAARSGDIDAIEGKARLVLSDLKEALAQC